MNLTKIVFFKWVLSFCKKEFSANRQLNYIFLLVCVLFFSTNSGFSQFIIHVQDWEGVAGSGDWIRDEAPTNKWTRGTDTDGVYWGSKGTYISNDDTNFAYTIGTTSEAFAYKDIEFPAYTDGFYLHFYWKCVGDVGATTAYDYMRVFLVPTTTGLNETDLETAANGANGFEILGPGLQDRFVQQPSFVLENYPLTTTQNDLVENKTYRLVFLWKNDNEFSDGIPAAFDNVIISDGDASQPLSGTYQIGKNSIGTQRFDSIMHATALLNMNGVAGNVVFELTDEDYPIKTGDLPLRIKDFNANPNSTVSNAELLMQPVQDGSITPIISGSRANNAIIFIDQADNVTVNGDNGGTLSNDLIIENNSTSTPNGIYLGSEIATSSATNNIEINNVNINLSISDGIGLRVTSAADYSAGLFDNISISNNSFSGGRMAIYVNGNDGTANGSRLTIANNSINSTTNPIGLRGIEIFGTSTISISNNHIGNITSGLGGNVRGIRLGGNCSGATIEKNEIYNLSHTSDYGAHGISLATASTSANTVIKNNIIYNISGDGWNYTDTFIDNSSGIALQGTQSGISILNNSIYLKEGGSNIVAASASSYTACLAIETGSVVNVLKNNILINTLGGTNGTDPAGYSAIAYQGTFTNHFPDIDYNFYYTRVNSGSGAGESLATDFTSSASSLADLKILSANDQSSIGASSGDIATFNGPGFTFSAERLFDASNQGQGTFLKIDEAQQESWLLNAGGTHLPDVTEDFDGVARNTAITAVPPCMGAFEFTPAVEPVAAYQAGAITDAGTSEFYVANRKMLAITWNQNGGTLPSSLDVKYYPGNLPPDTDGYPVFNGYVQILAPDGSGFNYDIELAYEPALLAGIPATDIKLTKRSDAVNDWYAWPTTVNTTDRIFSVVNIDTEFSYFTGTNQENPLPVELLSFTAQTMSGRIELEWETATEKNNEHFDVEKKGVNNDWHTISTVAGAGNSNALIQYSISDFNPISGTQYYRLKQVDTDGKFEYSSVLRVDYGTNGQEVFPNPFMDKIFVKTNGEDLVERIELKNITGNAINISKEYLGQNKWKVNTHSLETGTYILYIYSGNQVEVRKVVKR
ncbi:T9SS type A sorting domain-containing protein [Marivirga salinae]|uniref:T9SS type A sorting domain-containing protein n=1 Tax=Marivirga salinarum TaxID=3059078 RepID=A0AA51RBL6_9BACT|nr:T9SS type A sorting domain-containing protein [Marivirga sp. BDSF4-3]WMN12391.1 T9SS type A sorting domain-containing protein [Marivirga sp. BDSF4-3]